MFEKLDSRINNIPENIWIKITAIDRLAGQFTAGAHYIPEILSKLKHSVLITSTGASTRIEGSKLTDDEIEDLITKTNTVKFKDRDSQEAKGYYELLNNVFNSWREIPFSESTIKQFNNELLRFVDSASGHRGNYKNSINNIAMLLPDGTTKVIQETTPPYLTPIRMAELVSWTKKAYAEKRHPIIIIGNFIAEYLAIHPFLDGNGRGARALTNLLLLKSDYQFIPYTSHEKLIEDDKANYYLALRQSAKTFNTRKETIIPWLAYLTDKIQIQAEMAADLLTKENIAAVLSKKQLAVWEYLHTVADASPNEISKITGVNRETVTQVLNKLLKLKKIERLGFTNATRYKILPSPTEYQVKEHEVQYALLDPKEKMKKMKDNIRNLKR